MKRAKPAPGSMAHRFDLLKFTDDLICDLGDLRAGRITVREAKARAELAKMALRSIGLVIQAQRLIEGKVAKIGASRDAG